MLYWSLIFKFFQISELQFQNVFHNHNQHHLSDDIAIVWSLSFDISSLMFYWKLDSSFLTLFIYSWISVAEKRVKIISFWSVVFTVLLCSFWPSCPVAQTVLYQPNAMSNNSSNNSVDFPKPPFIPFVRLKVEGADNELHVATGAHGSDEAEIDTLHDNMMYPNIYIPNW